MSRAIIKVQELKRPYSGEECGFRLVAAEPNMAGNAYGKPVPSFGPKYRLETSSDMSQSPTPDEVWAFMDLLTKRGYTKLEML